MKIFAYILIVIFFTSIKVFANTDLSIQAEKLYEQKKYKEAIVIYDSIINQKQTSFKLYYNLGNCYFKTNQLGKAIYYYELAKKINPKDADVKVNLNIANSKTIDKIDSKENYFLGAIKTSIVNFYSSNGLAWISILSLILFLGFLFLFFVSKSQSIKLLGFFIGIISFIGFISSMIIGYASINQKKEINYGIILQYDVKVHSEPNTDSESKFSLHEGTKVSVLSQTNKWVNIKLENGNEGWLEIVYLGLF